MKRFVRAVLFPSPWLCPPLCALSTAGLIWVFGNGLDTHLVAYGIYVLSAYTLTVLTLYFTKVFPKSYARIKQRLFSHPQIKRFFTDPAFKTHILLHTSFGTNLLYALMNGVFAAVYQTAWFAIFAGYYVLLAAMRFLLLRYVSRHELCRDSAAEWRRARVCAYVLICIIVSLSLAVAMILSFGHTFSYPGLLIYVMAAYTFYITTVAIINLVQYRRHGSPILSFAKIVTLSAALVSMLALETAMLDAFGAQTAVSVKNTLIGLSGFGICLVITALSIHTIACAAKQLRTPSQSIKGDPRDTR